VEVLRLKRSILKLFLLIDVKVFALAPFVENHEPLLLKLSIKAFNNLIKKLPYRTSFFLFSRKV
jgi:hypothetical protein